MSPPSKGPRSNTAIRARAVLTRKCFQRFGGVHDGTYALLNEMRKRHSLSMEQMLYRLVRLGERNKL